MTRNEAIEIIYVYLNQNNSSDFQAVFAFQDLDMDLYRKFISAPTTRFDILSDDELITLARKAKLKAFW